jgi:hypothetical protein
MDCTALERRVQSLQNHGVHDETSYTQLENLVQQCADHVQRLSSFADGDLICEALPIVLQTIFFLSLNCTEKSELIGSSIKRDKLHALIVRVKSLHQQVKETIKSPKLIALVSQSTGARQFCHRLRLVSDGIGNTDMLMTLICQKIIVKLITGASDDQQSQSVVFAKIDSLNDGLIGQIFSSIVQQITAIAAKNFRDRIDTTRETATIKVEPLFGHLFHGFVPAFRCSHFICKCSTNFFNIRKRSVNSSNIDHSFE